MRTIPIIAVVGIVGFVSGLLLRSAGSNVSAEQRGTKATSPQPITGPTPIEQSRARPVAAALQGHYNSSAEKYHAVLQALERSGTPQQEKWESSGLRMGNEMMRRGISDKWKCYDAGCYFVVSADRAQSPDLALDIVKTRDAVAHGYIVAITADDAPYKMAILLNYYPDLESQQSGGSK